MPKATILFADNDADFLKTRSEFLEQEGYLVVPVSNPTEARRKLEAGGIDLAILDIRLVDDDDEKDVSGLTLAKEVARTVPKVILTGFPSYDYVREALRPQLDGLPATVDFVAKQEGPEVLLLAIRKTLGLTPKRLPRATLPSRSNLWISGSFYLVVVVIAITLVTIVSRIVPWYLLPIVLIAGLLVVVVIGALTLRTEEKLSEASFLRLMVETLKRLPLLGYRAPSNSSKDDDRGRK